LSERLPPAPLTKEKGKHARRDNMNQGKKKKGERKRKKSPTNQIREKEGN